MRIKVPGLQKKAKDYNSDRKIPSIRTRANRSREAIFVGINPALEHAKKGKKRLGVHGVIGETGDERTPRDQVSLSAHALEYGKRVLAVARFGVEANEGVEKNRVEGELRVNELVVKEFAKLQITRPDAGFEEKGGVYQFLTANNLVLLHRQVKPLDAFAEF